MILIKVVVAGSRGFEDYELLKNTLDQELFEYDPSEIQIVSGGADGADTLGERYQKEHGCSLKQFIPDWDRFGDSAGHRRNADMAVYGDWVFCFWDGQSKGTRGMIELARRAGKRLVVINYKENDSHEIRN